MWGLHGQPTVQVMLHTHFVCVVFPLEDIGRVLQSFMYVLESLEIISKIDKGVNW
jgi:hypothetical protein